MTALPHLNKQQLTVFLAVSRVVIDRLIAEGLPTVTGDRPRQSFDPAAVARWLLLRAETNAGGPDVEAERCRLLAAQADTAELRLARERGELVDVHAVASAWASVNCLANF